MARGTASRWLGGRLARVGRKRVPALDWLPVGCSHKGAAGRTSCSRRLRSQYRRRGTHGWGAVEEELRRAGGDLWRLDRRHRRPRYFRLCVLVWRWPPVHRLIRKPRPPLSLAFTECRNDRKGSNASGFDLAAAPSPRQPPQAGFCSWGRQAPSSSARVAVDGHAELQERGPTCGHAAAGVSGRGLD